MDRTTSKPDKFHTEKLCPLRFLALLPGVWRKSTVNFSMQVSWYLQQKEVLNVDRALWFFASSIVMPDLDTYNGVFVHNYYLCLSHWRYAYEKCG